MKCFTLIILPPTFPCSLDMFERYVNISVNNIYCHNQSLFYYQEEKISEIYNQKCKINCKSFNIFMYNVISSLIQF